MELLCMSQESGMEIVKKRKYYKEMKQKQALTAAHVGAVSTVAFIAEAQMFIQHALLVWLCFYRESYIITKTEE